MKSLEGLYSLTFAERKDIMTASATPDCAYYTFFEDSGHGWLKVPVSELIELGIENDISHYSYMFGDWAYLEEDCDMARFIDYFNGSSDVVVNGGNFCFDVCYSDQRSIDQSLCSFDLVRC